MSTIPLKIYPLHQLTEPIHYSRFLCHLKNQQCNCQELKTQRLEIEH